uniref:Carbonic anhydrase n=1 Tax=Stylophora pistillata TaxID=50429 RepID=A0A1B0Y360_STYPI|nr:alpha carbonic anhydrase 13 [Stylophora pistillata]
MLGTIIVVFVFFLPCSLAAGHEVLWKYGNTVHSGHQTVYGPQDWVQVSRHCGEKAQSPVNIDTVHRNSFQKLTFLKGFSFKVANMWRGLRGRLFNNGHAPTIKIEAGFGLLSGGPWGSDLYRLAQLHFHFGCKSSPKGSEHTLDGIPFSGELHLVFYNLKYADFNAAADKSDGLTVIAAFLEENRLDVSNPELEKIAHLMRNMARGDREENERTLLEPNLYSLVPQLTDLSMTPFFSYKGSLTTPPCYQSVNWIVLGQFIPANTYVMDIMRSLRNHDGHPLCNGFRPPQALNGRVIRGYVG